MVRPLLATGGVRRDFLAGEQVRIRLAARHGVSLSNVMDGCATFVR